MISISYEALILTVIALALTAIAGAVAWLAYRTSRTLAGYDRLAPVYERVGLRAEELLEQLGATIEDIRGAAREATAASRNGADGVDSALGLVRQLTAVGSGLKMAVETFQTKKRSR